MNRLKKFDLVDKVPEELWIEFPIQQAAAAAAAQDGGAAARPGHGGAGRGQDKEKTYRK